MLKVSRRHHYSPEGYLKRWMGIDGKLAVFLMQGGVLRARSKTPAQVGWEFDLYSSDVFHRPDEIERSFMAPLDSVAAEVMDLFTAAKPGEPLKPLSQKQRDGWTRFLMSTLHRTPKRVADRKAQFARMFHQQQSALVIPEEVREEYLTVRGPDWPEAYEEYVAHYVIEHGTARIVAMLSDSVEMGTALNGMEQMVFVLHGKHNLLTSDQPLVLEGGFKESSFRLGFAVGPRHLFVASKTPERMKEMVRQFRTGKLVKDYNASVCINAERFVFGTYESEIGFVRKHFQRLPSGRRS
jgi:hypothetical protein